MDRRTWLATTAAALVPLAGCLDGDGERGESTPSDAAETATPETVDAVGDARTADRPRGLRDDGGTGRLAVGFELGSVTAAVADTGGLRYTGLSDTEVLPEDRGMLFVFESVADRTFVMRRMDFGIDIVYADAEGTITGIHHAPAPGPDEDGNSQGYPGRGQYVLEVNYGWTTERGVTAGDRLEFDGP